MKTTPFLFLVALSLLFSCNDEPSDSGTPPTSTVDSLEAVENVQPPEGFLKTYEGTLGEKNEIKMVLINWGDGFFSGRYWYKKHGKPIELSGEKLSDTQIQLLEGEVGEETGAFSVQFSDPTLLTGTWSSPDKKRNLPFELKEMVALSDSTGWTGKWFLNEIWDGGMLLIGNVEGGTFDFALNVFRSSHVGTVEGQARISENKAEFRKKEFDEEPCILKFEHGGDYILIDQTSSNFSCGFGARAYAGGRYDKKFIPKKATLSVGRDDDHVFPDSATHQVFKALVGKSYEDFAFNMQQIEKEKSLQEDQLNATVVTGFVPGMFTTNEAVIIFDGQGKLWAATIVTATSEAGPEVWYFTNDLTWKNHLPKTISDWMEGFKNYKVVFK